MIFRKRSNKSAFICVYLRFHLLIFHNNHIYILQAKYINAMLIPNVWMSTIKLDKLFLLNPYDQNISLICYIPGSILPCPTSFITCCFAGEISGNNYLTGVQTFIPGTPPFALPPRHRYVLNQCLIINQSENTSSKNLVLSNIFCHSL